MSNVINQNIKLISFSFAGGNRFSFQKILGSFRNSVVIEYPRKNMDLHENSIKDIEEIVDYVLPRLKEEISTVKEYVIYGHSMGALVAYLVCQRLQELGWAMPQKLIVSGRKAPSVAREKKIANLGDEEFWEEVVSLGGIPKEMLGYPELINYYLPILKYDFRLVENYQYRPQGQLNIPIDVFYGSEEAFEEEMIEWEKETFKETKITQLNGDHFFIFHHVDYFKKYFNNVLDMTS